MSKTAGWQEGKRTSGQEGKWADWQTRSRSRMHVGKWAGGKLGR